MFGYTSRASMRAAATWQLMASTRDSSIHKHLLASSSIRGDHNRPAMADQQQHGDSPPPSRALAVAALLAVTGGLLLLSCTALAASVARLAVAAPVLLLCIPVLIPAALLVLLEATGMVVSGALALGAMALLWPLASAARKAAATPPDYVEEGKRRVAELAGETTSHVHAGQILQTS